MLRVSWLERVELGFTSWLAYIVNLNTHAIQSPRLPEASLGSL